jgi:primosomal protein N' (replication factor Y)
VAIHAEKTVQVAFPIPVRKLFTYLLPDRTERPPEPGTRVLAPFGKKILIGFVVRPEKESERGVSYSLKRIVRIIDEKPLLDIRTIEIAEWMSRRYMNSLGEVLDCFLSMRFPAETEYASRNIVIPKGDLSEALITGLRRTAPVQSRCLSILHKEGSQPLSVLTVKENINRSSIKSLENKGLVTIQKVPVSRIPTFTSFQPDTPSVQLTEEQKRVVRQVASTIRSETFRVFLLHGVTGSGKTQVYLEAAKECRAKHRSALILVPEISLTPQIYWQFRPVFGKRVTLYHSNLSRVERRDIWREVRKGSFDVVIGARSALFLPFRNTGLIVIDEEHDTSYRQATSPSYHARDIAVALGKLLHSTVILGSATPSVESYYRSLKGRYSYSSLSTRVRNLPLPRVTIVNMREEYSRGNRGAFSRLLEKKMHECLENGNQCILLQNRRGFSAFIQCRDCGHIPQCPQCSVTLTFHKTGRMLRCHYCGFQKSLPARCPDCSGSEFNFVGTGTQRIAEEVERHFPGVRILRMDRDSTRQHLSHFRILEKFRKGEADILLGTQMISQGLDFPRVQLVGVISADIGLYFPTFRGGERIFQLLTHVAGRSGRGKSAGEVVVQTFTPHHYGIEAACRHDYHLFFSKEIAYREELFYPPFSRLLQLTFIATRELAGRESAVAFKTRLISLMEPDGGKGRIKMQIMGPAPALIRKIKGKYRWLLLVKTADMDALLQVVSSLMAQESMWKTRGTTTLVEVDPIDTI